MGKEFQSLTHFLWPIPFRLFSVVITVYRPKIPPRSSSLLVPRTSNLFPFAFCPLLFDL